MMGMIERLRIAGNQCLERFDDGAPVRDVLWAAADLLEEIRGEITDRELNAGYWRIHGPEMHIQDRLAEQRELAKLLRWLDQRLDRYDM